jgi:hypothetical protein
MRLDCDPQATIAESEILEISTIRRLRLQRHLRPGSGCFGGSPVCAVAYGGSFEVPIMMRWGSSNLLSSRGIARPLPLSHSKTSFEEHGPDVAMLLLINRPALWMSPFTGWATFELDGGILATLLIPLPMRRSVTLVRHLRRRRRPS